MNDFDFSPPADDAPDALGDAHSPIHGFSGEVYESWTQTEVTHFESVTSYETVYGGHGEHLDTYTVQPGDSLWRIAESYLGDGSLWPEIHALNPWIDDPNLIYPGQELVLPDSHDHGGQHDGHHGGGHHDHGGHDTYTVQPGDSLWRIAENNLGDGSRWPEIAALNPDVAEHPDLIFPGDELVMPDSHGHGGHHGDDGSQTYTVRSGDSLSEIAREQLGDGNRWPEIHALNPWIDDPNLIYPGQELQLPPH